MKFNLIDIEHWNRKPYFEYYLHSVRCTYSMTANIEITNLLHEIKLKNLNYIQHLFISLQLWLIIIRNFALVLMKTVI